MRAFDVFEVVSGTTWAIYVVPILDVSATDRGIKRLFEASHLDIVTVDVAVNGDLQAAFASGNEMEVRANEFMGALLVPQSLVRVDFLRLAKRHRLCLSHKPSQVIHGAPAVDGQIIEAEAATEILNGLGELYGVSESFMRVRLSRYDLLRTPRPVTFQ